MSLENRATEVSQLHKEAMDEENSNYNKRWKENTNTMLHAVFDKTCQPYCIPVVPDELRKWNENAHIPKVVSIGPRHRGRKELLSMEEIKWECMMHLLHRTSEPSGSLEKCMDAILKLDAAVRASYLDEIKLDRYDLATIMVLDGCFLLCLLIPGSKELNSRLPSGLDYNDPGEEVRKMEQVLSDLTLVENQIPFFILETLFTQLVDIEKLYEYCRAISISSAIKGLALSLFGFNQDLGSIPNYRTHDEIHFLEIVYSYILWETQIFPIKDSVVNTGGEEEAKHELRVEHLNRCATRLRAAGIIIQRMDDNNTRRVSTYDINIKFTNSYGILEIPQLNILRETEAQWRSFIAWEHHKKKWKRYSARAADIPPCLFTSSAVLFSDLICSASDVQLLKDKGVIVDHLNMSNRDLVVLFHSIAKGVDRGIIDPLFCKKFHALNTYSATNYATKFLALLCHYFSRFLDWLYSLQNFLGRGYNFAISIVAVLTAIQTAYAIVAYQFPRK